MKNLSRQRKDDSIQKWQDIIQYIKAKAGEVGVGHYNHHYWCACGFCHAAMETVKTFEEEGRGCTHCVLSRCVRRTRICYGDSQKRSHAQQALRLADAGNFKAALPHAEAVLAAILAAEVEV